MSRAFSAETREKMSKAARRRWAEKPWVYEQCSVESCSLNAQVKGLCTGHNQRLWKTGQLRPEVPLRLVSKKGHGRHVTRQGYVRVAVPVGHPERGKDGKAMEHRVVMTEVLGRKLKKFPMETIHHKNGIRSDNRPENLELRVGNHGQGATEAHCTSCTCFADAE